MRPVFCAETEAQAETSAAASPLTGAGSPSSGAANGYSCRLNSKAQPSGWRVSQPADQHLGLRGRRRRRREGDKPDETCRPRWAATRNDAEVEAGRRLSMRAIELLKSGR